LFVRGAAETGTSGLDVNVYVNNEGIESLQGLQTSLKDGDEVSIYSSPRRGRAALAWADSRTMILTPDEYARIQVQAIA